MKDKKPTITFTPQTVGFILEAIDLHVSDEGYVVDMDNDFVLDVDGNRFKPIQLIGIINKKFLTSTLQLIACIGEQ